MDKKKKISLSEIITITIAAVIAVGVIAVALSAFFSMNASYDTVVKKVENSFSSAENYSSAVNSDEEFLPDDEGYFVYFPSENTSKKLSEEEISFSHGEKKDGKALIFVSSEYGEGIIAGYGKELSADLIAADGILSTGEAIFSSEGIERTFLNYYLGKKYSGVSFLIDSAIVEYGKEGIKNISDYSKVKKLVSLGELSKKGVESISKCENLTEFILPKSNLYAFDGEGIYKKDYSEFIFLMPWVKDFSVDGRAYILSPSCFKGGKALEKLTLFYSGIKSDILFDGKSGEKLREVNIVLSTVDIITSGAFDAYENVEKLTIPDVTEVEEGVFANMKNLTEVRFLSKDTVYNGEELSGVNVTFGK